MKYQGGKARIAKRIVEVMVEAEPERTRWVEPFVGGAWVLERAAEVGQFASLHAGDAMPDLIELYKAVANDWEVPRKISRDLYFSLKKAPASPLRGLAGFGSAFGGKFMSGYCGDKLNGKRTNAEIAADHMERRRDLFRQTDLRLQDYRDWTEVIGPDTLVYCDPPYANTCGYSGAPEKFDSNAFWEWCAEMANRGAAVYVSEFEVPDWVEEVWSRTAKQTISVSQVNKSVTERLVRVPATIEERVGV